WSSDVCSSDLLASRLDADQLHLLIVEKGGEDADRIGAATHARDDGVWQPPSTLQYLGARLAADDGLEVAHQTRKGIRPDDRADDVVGRGDIGDPVAQRF